MSSTPPNLSAALTIVSADGYNTGHAAHHYNERLNNPYDEGTEDFLTWKEGFDAGYEDGRCTGDDSED